MRWLPGHELLMKLLGRLFFFIERQLCRIPGFMESYGDASDAWSKQLGQRVERAISEMPWDQYRVYRDAYLRENESPEVRAYWDRIRH